MFPHRAVGRLLWPLCSAHGSSFAYFSLSLIPFPQATLNHIYHITFLLLWTSTLRLVTEFFSSRLPAQVLRMQGTRAEKGIAGEEEHDFFSHPVSDRYLHLQEECICDGMKSEALVFSNI